MSSLDYGVIHANIDATSEDPKRADELFWEREPLAEYIYFVAGDWRKNENGLLLYTGANRSSEVEVSFENDVIDVAKYNIEYARSLLATHPSAENLLTLRLSELYDITCSFPRHHINEAGFPIGQTNGGFAWLTLYRETDSPVISQARFIWQKFHNNPNSEPAKRLTTVTSTIKNASDKLEIAYDPWCQLKDRYADIKWHQLSGAVRM